MTSIRLNAAGLRHRLGTMLFGGALLVLLAGGGFAAFESRVVATYWEGVWWALSLMTTVGFIGEAPETVAGRLLSSVLMVAGFALMAVTTASIASLFVQQEEKPQVLAEREYETSNTELLEHLLARLDSIESTLRSLEAQQPPPSDS
jgi:hypothetical protein